MQRIDNILDDKCSYVHQYLTAVFQLELKAENEPGSVIELDNENLEISTIIVHNTIGDKNFTFDNYFHHVFESLMCQVLNFRKFYVDNRFFPENNAIFKKEIRIHDDYTNKIAYLFDCYCRLELINDFANLITDEEKKNIKRYIIEQSALLLVMPYMNSRYEKSRITPYDDLFDVITLDISWMSDYMNYVKRFFIQITTLIENARTKQSTEDISSLSECSEEELRLEIILQPLYEKFCKRFKIHHCLTSLFIDDIKYLHLFIATPTLAEIFIDLNSPQELLSIKDNNDTSGNNGPSTTNSNNSSSNNNNNNNNRNPFRELFGNNPLTFDSEPNEMEKFFQQTLLGTLLCNSPLPSIFSKYTVLPVLTFLIPQHAFEFQFYNEPSTKTTLELHTTELEIDSLLYKLRENITEIFFALLRSRPNVRTKTLKWLECCLVTFNNRSKLWSNEVIGLVTGNAWQIFDGFLLNLSSILLNLCRPFCSFVENGIELYPDFLINPKMLKVDPLFVKYCKKISSSPDSYNPYLQLLKNESTIVSCESNLDLNENELKAFQANFITRCFFMTHKALNMGFRIAHERFNALNQENGNLQRRIDSNIGPGHIIRSNLSNADRETFSRIDRNMTTICSLKATLTEKSYLNLLMEFYLATAGWINNLAVCESEEEAIQMFKQLELKNNQTEYFKCKPTKCLKMIPEFIIENVVDFWLYLRYFEIAPKEIFFKTGLDPFMGMIIIFMGSPNRMRNPHLRAKMAEMLEALLPNVQANIHSSYLEPLFLKPYFVEELFPALMNGFVSIEISDETNNTDVVAFEQKFNYRRPMYVVFKYLCTIKEHQQKLVDLANDAETNIDSVQLPIFLRFINLLVNDAIFLLDEGLSLMSRLRELEKEKPNWPNLMPHIRQQHEANYQHLGRLAKFHNFIGRDTITTLTKITSHVTSLFSQRILVDRIAAMLNYFLLNLVGPNKRNFKVKHMNDFEFHPSDLVKNICQIYVNLACDKKYSPPDGNFEVNPKYEQFCLAIGRDDRSYYKELLIEAEEVLNKIGHPMIAVDISRVDTLVKDIVERNKHTEIPVDDIPEEFLDPLMNTLMKDPVILPNSHKVLDRATITRHLLSDHTDPYTRTPLTMDMLISDIELRKRIEEFIESKANEMENKK